MEKVSDSHSSSESVTPTSNNIMKVKSSHSSSEPVTPTSNEMMKQLRVLKVEARSSEMGFEKIKCVLGKLDEETHNIDTYYNERKGTAIVFGFFDPEKLKLELENEAGDAIKSITDASLEFPFEAESFRVPEMQVPVALDSPTIILYHGEKAIEEPIKSSQWCCWCRS